jgi:toxin ParE1/3/4
VVVWRPRLGAAAERDLIDIVRWTTRNFGTRQAKSYRDLILAALGDLCGGPTIPGSRKRDDIGPDIYSLSVARRGRRARLFLLFRSLKGQIIEVVRILHVNMEIERHLPPELFEPGDLDDPSPP